MVYIQADGSLAAGMLYLRGGPEHRDDHWMMVDKGTGLPVWIDSTLRSARGSFPERSHTNPISSTLTRPLRPSTFHLGPGRTVRSPA